MELVPDKLEWSLDEEEPSIWRYRQLLPPTIKEISLGEGLTSLRRVEGILIKDETRNPTGSYVDRGSSVLASCLKLPKEVKLGFSQDVTSSLATYLVKAGIKVKIDVDPENVELTELLYLSGLDVEISYGKGSGVVYESPYMIEGFKTISYEIAESRSQIDGIIVPAESGVLAYSLMKGFKELEEMSIFSSPPMYLAHHGGAVTELIEILESQGAKLMEVKADDALRSLIQLAKKGIYVKPVAAKSYSLAEKLGGNKVAVLTGSGLRKWSHELEQKPLTPLQRKILSVMEGRKGMTAYQIWRKIDGASLQGVYKALSKLVDIGIVERRNIMSKRRKIGVYTVKRWEESR